MLDSFTSNKIPPVDDWKNANFGVNQPRFEAIPRSDALKELKSLSPAVLSHVAEKIKKFNSLTTNGIDEVYARQLIAELGFVYFLMPITIQSGHVIFRGRTVEPKSLLATVDEFYAPQAQHAKAQRASGIGESVFYGADKDETVLAEIRAKTGQSINIAAFSVKVGCEITAHTIGEIDHYRRWRRSRFLPPDVAQHAEQVLAELHPNVALAIQLVDAFLADHFSRSGEEAYRVTNLIAREFFSAQSIDAIVYPSVAFTGGTNYAIKNAVSKEKLEVKASTAIEILDDYGYGSYRGGRFGLAKIDSGNDSIPWVTPEGPPHKLQNLVSATNGDPGPIQAWLRLPKTFQKC